MAQWQDSHLERLQHLLLLGHGHARHMALAAGHDVAGAVAAGALAYEGEHMPGQQVAPQLLRQEAAALRWQQATGRSTMRAKWMVLMSAPNTTTTALFGPAPRGSTNRLNEQPTRQCLAVNALRVAPGPEPGCRRNTKCRAEHLGQPRPQLKAVAASPHASI